MSIKILTVDDSRTVRLIVAKAFKPFDCVILEGSNGVEGLAVATKEKPDIIILDITMPVMDGYETLTKLKSDPDLKSIPVIMLTAEAGKDNVLRIAKLGVRDYLIKPFKEEVVVERVARVVPLKPKGESVAVPKKVDDPVGILVVDDKPAILEQIRAGFVNSPWKIMAVTHTGEAIDACGKSPVDIALVSLSLPENAATLLYQTLRANPRTKSIPVLGLSVKTAVDEQARAQQVGFVGMVTKPIDLEDLKTRICRTLSLDTTSQYFQQREGAMLVTIPAAFNQGIANAVSGSFVSQATNAVDAGLDKMILDLSQLQKADIVIIKLVMEAIETCRDIGLRHGLIGSAAVSAECKNFEETQGLSFATTLEEALMRLNAKREAA